MPEKISRTLQVTSDGKTIKSKIEETKTTYTAHVQSCDGGTKMWGQLFFDREPSLHLKDELKIEVISHQKTLKEDPSWSKSSEEKEEEE